MKQTSLSLLAVTGVSLISGVLGQSPAYGQCGGIGWTGATTCVSGYTCTYSNDWYSQCLPGTAATSTTTKPPSTTTTPTSTKPPSTTPTTSKTSTSTSSQPTSTNNPALTAAWQTAISKAKTYLAKFTNQNKIDLVTGVGWMGGKCLGNTKAIPSVNFPGLCLQDSPVGIRSTDKNSVFPAGINVASTFNRDLMKQRGAALGAEFKGKGVHVALGPMMNIARVPTAGRNWEGFGGDPYLSGEGAYQTIVGMQSSGVQACAKHYINNEQELNRETSSSNVDDRTQHEVYLAPFLKSVQAGVASVMCSYNKINGEWACENDKMLNQILKNELGFPGYVMSDWSATHSTLSANKGLDMTMPGDVTFGSGTSYFGPALLTAVTNGQVPQSRLDDMATRILAGWYLLGQDSNYPAMTLDSWNLSGGGHVDVQGDHKNIIRQIGAASTVVLKNNGILPLKKPKTIGIIGNDAGPGNGPNAYGDRAGLNGVLALGWGSGTAEFPYLITPLDAIKSRSAADGTVVTSTLSDSDLNTATSVATGKDVAIVFIAADSGEGYLTVEGNVGDRKDLSAWHSGDALVAAVAKANTKTIVVIHSVGPINMEAWADNANVAAIVFAGLPGQEAGNSLADVLYGDVNPSGRLPFTVGKQLTDYPAQINSASSFSYSEGLLVDYKWFDAKNITPRYPFGFGLSYTTFTYSGLTITGSVTAATGPTGVGSSLDPWLQNPIITVSFTVTNSGTISGTEIPQLYVSPPASANSAPKHLRGFTNVSLAAGASATVSLTLSRYDLAMWSTSAGAWQVPAGTHGITIGASSRDPKLTGSITA